MHYLLDEMGLNRITTFRSWLLNERHFGGLDDLTREEAESRFGQETLRLCREDFRFRPPQSTGKETFYSGGRPPNGVVPRSESMSDATIRALACWRNVIVPVASTGMTPLVVSHGEILRLLTGHLLGMSEDEIVHTPVFPNATPMVIEFNDDFRVLSHYSLAGSCAAPEVSAAVV
jgi:2,3-bisphosphoglycerate-dependent phosphoglycerate mutase